jgi:hypothetical protein
MKDRGSRWAPKLAPENPEDLPKYLHDELQKLSGTLFQIDNLHLNRLYKEPEKPQDGDIILADKGVIGAIEDTPSNSKSGIYYFKLKDDDSGTGQWWFLTAEYPQ